MGITHFKEIQPHTSYPRLLSILEDFGTPDWEARQIEEAQRRKELLIENLKNWELWNGVDSDTSKTVKDDLLKTRLPFRQFGLQMKDEIWDHGELRNISVGLPDVKPDCKINSHYIEYWIEAEISFKNGRFINVYGRARYSEFADFNRQLIKKYGQKKIPNLPSKKLCGRFKEKFIDKRRIALAKWLIALIDEAGLIDETLDWIIRRIPGVCELDIYRRVRPEWPRLEPLTREHRGKLNSNEKATSLTSVLDLPNIKEKVIEDCNCL
ncbi:hypothetical protein G9A89_004579 [Geosiphon pyriformis]|nr:hypothetical protein G9A89_004579 [Geosiphon pyriformis]